MIFENKSKATCPVTNQEVELTELYQAEAGGSCQADVMLISCECSASGDCTYEAVRKECLLISDIFR